MFTRKKKTGPKLLERLMGWLRDNGVKLFLPEVVQLGVVEKVGATPDPKRVGRYRQDSFAN